MSTVQMVKFDPTDSSNKILFINMLLHILNFRFSKYFWIIKYISLEPVFFAINLGVASSLKFLALLIL